MWHAWIQNKELHVVLMFPINHQWCKNGTLLQKMWGVTIYLLQSFQIDTESFNLKTNLKVNSVEQFESERKTLKKNEGWVLKTPNRP